MAQAGKAARAWEVLAAVAVYAAGGRKALSEYSEKRGGVVRQLTHQVK